MNVANPLHIWVVSLHDATVGGRYRSQIENNCEEHDPDHMRVWFSGMLKDLTSSLPATDPWTGISVRLGNIERKGLFELPATDGAIGKFGDFGTWVDGTDIVALTHHQLETDPHLISLAEALTPRQAAILGLASTDYSTIHQATNCIPDGLLFNDLSTVLRWLLWRRNNYVGADDDYLLHVSSQWVKYTPQILGGMAWPRSQALLEHFRIPDEDYMPYVL